MVSGFQERSHTAASPAFGDPVDGSAVVKSLDNPDALAVCMAGANSRRACVDRRLDQLRVVFDQAAHEARRTSPALNRAASEAPFGGDIRIPPGLRYPPAEIAHRARQATGHPACLFGLVVDEHL